MVRGFYAALGVLLVAWPAIAAAAPCAGFIDADDSSPFCVNVTRMKNRGVTVGCTANQYAVELSAGPVSRIELLVGWRSVGSGEALLNGCALPGTGRPMLPIDPARFGACRKPPNTFAMSCGRGCPHIRENRTWPVHGGYGKPDHGSATLGLDSWKSHPSSDWF